MFSGSRHQFSIAEYVQTEHNYSVISKSRDDSRKVPLKESVRRTSKVFQKDIRMLRLEISRLRKKTTTFKARLANAEKLAENTAFQQVAEKMSSTSQLFMHMQLQNVKKSKGRRFTIEEKVLCLSLFKKSPKCYKLLHKYFTLPSIKAMQRLISQIKVCPGINPIIFKKLKATVLDIPVNDRLCSLIFDEMSLTPQVSYDAHKDSLEGFSTNKTTEFADHALVFMIKGIKNFDPDFIPESDDSELTSDDDESTSNSNANSDGDTMTPPNRGAGAGSSQRPVQRAQTSSNASCWYPPTGTRQQTPDEYLTVDETMVAFRGRIKFMQYIPGKRHKYGIKLFKICGDDGYTFDLIVYEGKKGPERQQNLSKNVVMELSTKFLDAGRSIITDNYYTSVDLAESLLQHSTHLIGTVRKNRKGLPKNVVGEKLKKGELVAMENEKGILVFKWKDKREVLALSTKHKVGFVTVTSKRNKNKCSLKPIAIADYNKHKCSIDLSDQMGSYCNPSRRSIRWFQKLAVELILNTSVINAFLVYTAHKRVKSKRYTITKFREQLSIQLLGLYQESTNVAENREAVEHKESVKQPVAYYFTTKLNKLELKTVIKEVIINCQNAGLIVINTVCDQSTVNVSAISDMVSDTKALFLKNGKEWRHDVIRVNKRNIIPLYDVPHLIKGIRNNLLNKDMSYEVDNEIYVVKWEYFQKLYAADTSYGELRLLDKITEEHINPEKINKMRVKCATQIFSHSVAVAAEHLTGRGNLPIECKQLIKITLLLDNLFDSLNVNSFNPINGKKYKGAVRRNSCHHQLWRNAKQILKTIRFREKKFVGNKIRLTEKVVPSVTNFIKTIEGMEAIWDVLSKKYGFDTLFTRNFNQDPAENFFGNVRSFGGRNNAPNSVAFQGAFKALLLNNYNSPHSNRSNCEEDNNKCLQSLHFFLDKEIIETSDVPTHEGNVFCNEDIFDVVDFNNEIDAGQRNYVCGWVLTKCLKNVAKGCKQCKEDLLDNKNDNESNAFIKAKEYANKKWLCYPNKYTEHCFHEIQNIIISFLKKDAPKTNVKKNICAFINLLVNFPFKCQRHNEVLKEYFTNITLNVVLHSWCRSVNRILSGKIKYEGEDEIKTAAQLYYDKHKHYKNKK
ncbi:uncharacterized protein LOC106135789 [Amyelois transitella]|uniref:uncharacterized protein LOC106135789 n=1 Tax=Amyelois transitella TaxID=680683 RepID=UPI00298F92E3|nr:uncharacterized protein LOC106135789 [Amyelois transitella]